MKRTISAARLVDLLEHGLEPVLELAAELRPGDERAHVEGQQALVLERLGHVAVGDALGQALDDGRLADAGLADEDGIVLGPPRQDLDDPPDLVLAADDRVELALAGQRGQVARVLLEDLVLALGLGIGDALRAADGRQGLEHGLLRDAVRAQDASGPVLAVLEHGQEEVLGRDVLVLELVRLLAGRVEDLAQGSDDRTVSPPPLTFGRRARAASTSAPIFSAGAPILARSALTTFSSWARKLPSRCSGRISWWPSSSALPWAFWMASCDMTVNCSQRIGSHLRGDFPSI